MRVGNITIIILDNGLSPGRYHAIIWTNARILKFEDCWDLLSTMTSTFPFDMGMIANGLVTQWARPSAVMPLREFELSEPQI